MQFDVFNGDADGLCALHQWRLVHPAAAQRVTGVKRDVRLLARVHAQAGDVVTVFDIALRDNQADALRLLSEGAALIYFDHHESAALPASPAVQLHLDASPEVCTSLLVDRALGGVHRPWAVVAAFGDNLAAVAMREAAPLGLTQGAQEALAELGRLLNYNAYGDSLSDLHFHPEALYEAIRPYRDPLQCWREAKEVPVLRAAYAEDWARAMAIAPCRSSGGAVATLLPAEPWARRIHGALANALSAQHAEQAVAVLVENEDGTVRVSVRAASTRPFGADRLCRSFATGGGRALAAGISRLPRDQLEEFLGRFERECGSSSRA